MKSGWQTSTLGNLLAVLRNGVNCKQDKSGDGDRISRIESISDASFNLEKVGYAKLSEDDKRRYRLQPGDILFSHINSAIHVGKTAVFDNPKSVYHGVNLLLMRPRDTVTSAYLEHALKYLFQRGYWLKVCKQSVNQASVNQQDISKVEINYPKSLLDQQRIVGILDEAFEGIATAKANAGKNVQNARALFESHLQSVFTQRGPGWVEKRLDEVAESISTGPFGTMLHKSDYVLDGIPLVNPMNIIDSRIVPSSKMMVSKETRERLRSYVLKAGDVVIGRRGELGRCALVTDHEAGWLCGTGSFFVRLSDRIDARFFVALFGSQQFKSRLEGSAVGTTMSSLNHGILNDLRVPVPPIVVQKKEMVKADQLLCEIHRLESIYERKLTALEALKKSLLHQAFTGQL